MDTELRIGLVLEGGGAKGAFSFGFVQKCDELKINFSAVSGTSVGGLNAWLAATGQLKDGAALWRKLDFKQIYSPAIDCWQPVAALLFFMHAYQHWLQGLPPFFDRERRVNHILIALFRSITFIPLLLIYFSLLRPPDFVVYAGVGLFALYCLAPLAKLLKKLAPSDRGRGDRELDGMAGQMLGLLFLTFVAALILTGYRAITGDFGRGEMFVIIYAATLLVMSILSSLANLADTPLLATIKSFQKVLPDVPCFVTTAERVLRFSPYEPNIVSRSMSPTDPIEYTIEPSTYFIPHYYELGRLSQDQREQLLRATAALPFGLVASIDFDGHEFVDGGMADNLPAYPLLDLNLDVIVAVRLRPPEEKECPKAMLRKEIERVARLSTLLTDRPDVDPSGSEGELRREFSRVVGTVQTPQPRVPHLIVISPSEDLGGLLDFSDAEKKMALGALEAEKFAATLNPSGSQAGCEQFG